MGVGVQWRVVTAGGGVGAIGGESGCKRRASEVEYWQQQCSAGPGPLARVPVRCADEVTWR